MTTRGCDTYTGRDETESRNILGRIIWSGIGGFIWTSSLSAFRMFSLKKHGVDSLSMQCLRTIPNERTYADKRLFEYTRETR